MLMGHNIICFAPNDWWGMNLSCATHIMLRLARHNRVLFVNPFSSDISGAKGLGILARIVRKARSMARFLRRPHRNLYVFSPIFMPIQGKGFVDRLNNIILKLQMQAVCRVAGISKPILWVENLRASDMLEWFDSEAVVYHVSDLFTRCKYTSNRAALELREQNIVKSSDVVICVSEQLYSLMSARHSRVYYVPHGVDFQLFRHAAENGDSAVELAGVSRPIAGYFGTLTGNNDIELLEYCVRNLPDVSFVLAGQITGGDYSRLLERPNVYHLGKLAYQKIPLLCAGFNVCMLPWKVTEWIRSCNPLKLFEYMASGRPIVSVQINEVVNKYSDLISVAADKEEFCRLLSHELTNDTAERAARRIKEASEHNWDAVVLQLSGLIKGALSAREKATEEEVVAAEEAKV